MRPQLREMLNNLGGRIKQFDEDYAERVRQLIVPKENDGSVSNIIREMAGEVVGFPLSQKVPLGRAPETRMDKFLAATVPVAIPTASATARYVLPAAGVTAAGMGLAELTGQFYDHASNTPVLPMQS